MQIQILKDSFGKNTGVFIPMEDWNIISQKYEDLKNLANVSKTKKKISDLVGALSDETANAMLEEVKKGREDWESRLSK